MAATGIEVRYGTVPSVRLSCCWSVCLPAVIALTEPNPIELDRARMRLGFWFRGRGEVLYGGGGQRPGGAGSFQ
jgi:hypothetical protein